MKKFIVAIAIVFVATFAQAQDFQSKIITNGVFTAIQLQGSDSLKQSIAAYLLGVIDGMDGAIHCVGDSMTAIQKAEYYRSYYNTTNRDVTMNVPVRVTVREAFKGKNCAN